VTLSERIANARKAVVALLGVLTTLLAQNLLPGQVAAYVSTAAGIITVVLTYWVPNQPVGKHAADV
jgi:hypothetical protein